MQQRMSWPEQGSLIILHQCCINYTGFRCVSEAPSSWLWSPSSAFVVWRRLTWLTCASPFRRSSAGGSGGRLTAGHSSCHAPGLRSVGETLLCRARPHGTASPSNCGLHHCLLRRLRKNSIIIYSAASTSWKLLLNWRYINIHSFNNFSRTFQDQGDFPELSRSWNFEEKI